jgi:antitoxin-like ribbon-helix-helix protein
MATKNAPARSARARRSLPKSAEREFRGLLVRVNPAGLKELRRLAVDTDRTLQSLAVEALNDVLTKNGRWPIIENPLLRPKAG